jgi:hypothetical protein
MLITSKTIKNPNPVLIHAFQNPNPFQNLNPFKCCPTDQFSAPGFPFWSLSRDFGKQNSCCRILKLRLMLQLIVHYRIASRFIHETSQKVFVGRERQKPRQRFLFCICGFSLSFDETWRIEEKGRAMREIVQVQVGNYANFVGAHFWNFQVQVLSLHVFFFVGH